MKIVCRCEDVTEEDIINTIEEYGCTTLAELKQLLRIGMGHCQGRTCLILIAKILARKTGKSIDEILPSFRPPAVSVEIGLIGGENGK
ncbi:MAG TPA: (2Fe-2S)-binding protein [Thermoplasmata archaeon]|nr:(2Fe-2S)-binding protein [Thermoplasmata archaeon]